MGLLLFIGNGVLLTIGRWASAFTDFILINEFFHYHVSNLSLSLLFYLAIGSAWLLSGVQFHRICLLGCVILLANLVCETVMGFMNTPDLMDALFGAVCTAIAFVFLWSAHRHGLVLINKEIESPQR